jgi:hypothetical protein
MHGARLPRTELDAAAASVFELLRCLTDGAGQAGQRRRGSIRASAVRHKQGRGGEEDMADGELRPGGGRRGFFLLLFFIRILIGLTCGALVHLSKIIFLPHQPYRWAPPVRFSVNS